jgi:hypothetical protein
LFKTADKLRGNMEPSDDKLEIEANLKELGFIGL